MKVNSEKWIMVCAQVLYGIALGGLILLTIPCSDPLQIIGNHFAIISCIMALFCANYEYRTGELTPTIWIHRMSFMLLCGLVFLTLFILQPLS